MAYTLGQPFPRVPLSLKIPRELPDIQEMLNYAVWAEMDEVNLDDGELEIRGRYGINLKYCGMTKKPGAYSDAEEAIGCQCFYGNLCVRDTGYLDELEEDQTPNNENIEVPGVFACSWEDGINTYVEVYNSKVARIPLALKVENCELRSAQDGRSLEGYLILKLDKA